MTPREYILTVAESLRDASGEPPTHEEIEHELAVRCLDMIARAREQDQAGKFVVIQGGK